MVSTHSQIRILPADIHFGERINSESAYVIVFKTCVIPAFMSKQPEPPQFLEVEWQQIFGPN